MAESGFAESNRMEQESSLPPQRRAAAAFWPWIVLILVLAAALGWRALRYKSAPPEEDRGTHHRAVGLKLPELELAPLTGNPQPVSLADVAGKVTLINFWGPWCGFCIVEFPHLIELEQHFRSERGFQFFSVSTNPDPRDMQGLADETAQFLKQQRADFPTYYDSEAKSQIALVRAANLGDYGYPATIVLDRQGVIRGLWIGYHDGDERYVRQAIDDALRDSSPSPAGPSRPAS